MKIVEVETEKPKSEKAPKSSEYLTRDEYDSF